MSKPEFKFENITFGKALNDLYLESYIKSISDYNNKLPKASSSAHTFPIFLDTNVLLRYYETSLKFRDSLYKFLSERTDQIVLTNEVQREFVRNREDTIDRFISQSLGNFKKDYETKLVNGFNSYLNGIKSHLDDFPEIGTSIEEIQKKVDETFLSLDAKIDGIKDQLKELKRVDKYLDLFLKVKMLDVLNTTDIKLLQEQFDYLGKQLDEPKKNRDNKTASIFPGYLDKKRKGKNPYGDYIIFHEILHYMKSNNTDAVLLTFDAKGDWIKDNGEAHTHYIQIANIITGHHIFILDADRFFEQNLQTNFAPVSDVNNLDEFPPMKFDNVVSVVENKDFEKEIFAPFRQLRQIIRRLYQIITGENERNSIVIVDYLFNENRLNEDFYETYDLTKKWYLFYYNMKQAEFFHIEYLELLEYKKNIQGMSSRIENLIKIEKMLK